MPTIQFTRTSVSHSLSCQIPPCCSRSSYRPRPDLVSRAMLEGNLPSTRTCLTSSPCPQVVLVRRALGLAQKKAGGGPHKYQAKRPGTVGEVRHIKASPVELGSRASVHPMQGSVLSRGTTAVQSSAPTPHHGVTRQGGGGAIGQLPTSSPGSMRPRLAQGQEQRRPATHHQSVRVGFGGGGAGAQHQEPDGEKIDALGAKLDALAHRLQTVDARSQVIGNVLRGGGDDIFASLTTIPGGKSPRDAHGRHPGGLNDQQTAMRTNVTVKSTDASEGHHATTSSAKKAPNSIVTAMDSIQGTLQNLHFIFVRATADQHEAATRITKMARGFIARKRYVAGMAAMRSWRERQSRGMADLFNSWLIDRRQIHGSMRALMRKREVMSGRRCMLAWAELAWSVMPTRVNQRQNAYFMAVKVERRLLQVVLGGWVSAVRALKGRKEIAQRNMERYQRVRDRVELEAEAQGWREELIESVVKEELHEEAVSIMSQRRGILIMQSRVREWKRYHKESLRENMGEEKAGNHYIAASGKKFFRGWQRYIDECKRWDSGRYVRLRNERQLQLEVIKKVRRKSTLLNQTV